MVIRWSKRIVKQYTPLRLKRGLARWAASNAMELSLARLKAKGFHPSGIVDIGAYEGEWTKLAKRIWNEAPVWMFEAQEEKIARLNGLARSLTKATCVETLLGRHNDKQVTFYAMETGSSIYPEQTAAARTERTVRMRTLDSQFSNADQLTDGIIMKIDVQGAELEVLHGASQTLRFCEFLVLECSLLEYNKGAPLIGEVLAYLDRLDYVPFDIATLMRLPSGELNQVDMLFCRRNSPYRPTGSLW